MVLFLLRHRCEGIEIVQPLLYRNEAGSIHSRPQAVHNRCVDGVASRRVFGSIFVSGKIETKFFVAVFEGIDNLCVAN